MMIRILYLISVLVSKGTGSEDGGVIVICMGHDNQENAALHQSYLCFKEQVESNTELNLNVEIYPAKLDLSELPMWVRE